MTRNATSQRGFGKRGATFVAALAVLVAVLVFYGNPLRRYVRESFMQRVASAHYEILCPAGAMSPEAMRQFASQRESLFTALDRKLGDAGSNSEIRVIFDTESPAEPAYSVTAMTIRTKINGMIPELDPAADAEALLHVAWGAPGNARVSRWTAIWLVGDWQGEELGMAAARVEQRLGHEKVAALLAAPPSQASSDDGAILGAAWLSEIAELDGPAEVRKLYSSRMPVLNATEVAQTLGTAPLELERKWQMWMYAYLAGMPSDSQSAPMNMPMPSR